MNLEEMRRRMTALFEEAQQLRTAGQTRDLTADENTRMDAIVVEINELGEQITRAMNAETALANAQRLTQQPAGYVAARDHGTESGAQPAPHIETIDRRGPVARFLDSPEFRDAQATRGGSSRPFTLENLHGIRRSAEPQIAGDQPVSQRALLGSASAPASALLADVYPRIYAARERDLRMRDVLLNAQTTSDTITIMQETSFTNNAAEVAEATDVAGVGLTGGVKPESDLVFTEASFAVRWIGHWMPITRQMLDDTPFMQTYVEERLRTGILRREDNQFLNGNGTAPNLRGILETSGIQALDGAYFTANPVTNAGQDVENFNRILRAKRVIRVTGGAVATFVVINPVDYEVLQTVSNAQFDYIGTGPFANGAIPTLWGLPVVESENIAAGTALVGDGTMAAVVDRMEARIYTTDSHADYFIRNLFVILAEERVALPIFRPAAFAEVTLA